MIYNLGNFLGYDGFSNLFIFLSKQIIMVFTDNRIILNGMDNSIRESDLKVFVAVFGRMLPGFAAGVTSQGV